MICPSCGAADPGPGPFCMSCGQRLSTPTVTAPQTIARTQPDLASPLAAASVPSPAAPLPVSQMGNAGTVPFSIWGPFAGYGMRGRHVSWLINDQGERAEALRDIVAARFDRREIPGSTVKPVKLVRRGVLVDSRPYFLIRRGLTTAGLYIAQFGRDLYVSQVTYFKGPISKVRALIVLAMMAFAVIYPMIFNAVSDQIEISLLGGLESLGIAMTVICCVGPFYLLDWLGCVDISSAARRA